MRHDHRAAILGKLTPGEAAYARAYPLAGWQPGAPQLAEYAVHAAREVVAPGAPPTCAAATLATELARYAAAGWRFDRDKDTLTDAPAKQRALHRVLKLRGADRPPSASTIIRDCKKIDEYEANITIRQ